MNYLEIKEGHITKLSAREDLPECVHEFESEQILAVNAALAAGRPLLVRGEPGVGKSQLAMVVAHELKRAFIPQVVDSRTESRDLLYHFDAVARLADAQILEHLIKVRKEKTATGDEGCSTRLPVADYIQPRALWWAFNWETAQERASGGNIKTPGKPKGWQAGDGCVVLIDEIDKAESDVPNGLLEALGSGSFHPQGLDRPVKVTGKPPLVVITTNEERALPDAFVRRCLVLHLKLPSGRAKLINLLKQRGAAHFGAQTTETVLQKAAECLADDRETAKEHQWYPLPGQAEYLDLLRAVVRQKAKDFPAQELLIDEVKQFVLRKHPDASNSKQQAESGQ